MQLVSWIPWTDRALRLLYSLEYYGAPQDAVRKADDAIQLFVWSAECRRQARHQKCKTMDWGAKADKAHIHGKKTFNEAKKWLDELVKANESKTKRPLRRVTPSSTT